MAAPIVFRVVGDVSDLLKSLDESSKGVEEFGKKTASVGGKITKSVGSAVATAGKVAAVGVAGLATAAAGAGVAMFKLGDDFDKAYDTIAIGSGATGEQLEVLKDDFAAVAKSVPEGFDAAATAVADLNTRLGLSGPELQRLSTQFIDLSRLTGEDLSTNIDKTTRVFGDWGVAAEDTEETLDTLFRASQNSGIGFGELSTKLVQFGAPLRNVGFNLNESTALLSVFNKAGVNTETVIGGLRQGVGKLAKAGEDVPKTFTRVVREIEKLGPGTEATSKAIELFGQRAGPDLADAIAGGKFQIDDFLASIEDGENTIGGTAVAAFSFGEHLSILKNRVLVALEPVATRVFGAMSDLMGRVVEAASPMLERFSVWAEDVMPKVAAVFDSRILPALGALVGWIGEQIPKAIELGKSAFEAIRPTLETVATIFTEDVLPALSDMADFLVANLPTAFNVLKGALAALETPLELFGQAIGWISDHGPEVTAAIAALAAVKLAVMIPAVVASTTAWLANAAAVIAATWPFVAVAAVIAGLAALVVHLYRENETFREIVDNVKDAVVDFLKSALEKVKAFLPTLNRAWQVAIEWLGKVWEWVKVGIGIWWDFQKAMARFYREVVSRAIPIIVALGRKIGEMVVDFVGRVRTWVSTAQDIWGAIRTAATKVGEYVGDIIGWIDRAVDAISGFAGRATAFVSKWLNAGKRLGSAIIDGIKSAITSAAGFAGDLASGLARAIKNVINTAIVDPLNNALPNRLGAGPFAVDLPDNPVPRLAGGGEMLRSGIALVGERGPELVQLPRGAQVTPNHELRSMGGGITVNVATNADPYQIGREVAWALKTSGA